MDIKDDEIKHTSKLADDILAVVMNAKNVAPEAAISALAHVASIIAMELKMPEQVFAYCMKQCYQAVLEADKGREVH